MATTIPSTNAAADHVQSGDRRTLHFDSVNDILRDVEKLNHGEIITTGNWSAAQIVLHINEIIVMSLDGFTFKAPWVLRVIGRLTRPYFLKRGFKPGFKVPPNAPSLIPPSDTAWTEALEAIRHTVQRIRNGERMTVPSPLFGKLTHEQWEQFHCRHAELHFSFMHPATPASSSP